MDQETNNQADFSSEARVTLDNFSNEEINNSNISYDPTEDELYSNIQIELKLTNNEPKKTNTKQTKNNVINKQVDKSKKMNLKPPKKKMFKKIGLKVIKRDEFNI